MPAEKKARTSGASRQGWRFNITAKMFCAFLAVGVLVSVTISITTRMYFKKGFDEYLTEQENGRILILADSLAEEYAENGSWSFIQGDVENWRRLLGRHLRRQPEAVAGDDSPTEAARRSYQTTHLRLRLGLMDAGKQNLLAGTAPGDDAIWTPVKLEGTLIGWLIRPPLSTTPEYPDLHFEEQQRNTSFIVLAATLCLAALASISLARIFVAPLRNIGRTTNALSHGDYSARTDVRTKDEIRTLADQVNSLAVTLQRNEDARRIFMAEIAHELRTPLAVLRGEIEAMEDGVRPVTQEAVSSLQAEAVVLSRLVDDIHTLSLMDLGTLAYEKHPMDLNAFLAETLRSLGQRMAENGLSLELDLPVSEQGLAGAPVLADRARLSQVMNNLLENSLRYTHAPGVVRVSCRVEEDEAVLDIMDSAPGVAEDDLERIFERFHTTDPSRSRKSGGSGLGLSISKSIVEAHGGVIAPLMSPLGGLWIRITLPLQKHT